LQLSEKAKINKKAMNGSFNKMPSAKA